MIISIDVRLPFPRPLVYATYRDKLLQLIPYMPNVQQIELKSQRQDDGLIHFVYKWYGGGKIPVLARAFLSEDLLSWTDYATWNESKFTTDWRIETHAFTEAVKCAGQNRFFDNGSSTIIKSRGALTIDTTKIESGPQHLKAIVGRHVEDLLGQRIGPNFQQMSEGVRRYLEENQPK